MSTWSLLFGLQEDNKNISLLRKEGEGARMKCIVTDYSGKPMQWVKGDNRFYFVWPSTLIYREKKFRYQMEDDPCPVTIFDSPREALKYIKKSNEQIKINGGFEDFPYRIVLVQELRR